MDIAITARTEPNCKQEGGSIAGCGPAIEGGGNAAEYCVELELRLPDAPNNLSHHSHSDEVREIRGLCGSVIARCEHLLHNPSRRYQIVQGAPVDNPRDVANVTVELLKEAGKGVASLLGGLDLQKRRDGVLAYSGGIQYLAQALSKCAKREEEVNLLVRCEDPRLEELPWELIHVDQHLALLPQVRVVRMGPSDGKPESAGVEFPLDVLDVNMGQTPIGTPIDPSPVLEVPTTRLDDPGLTLEEIAREFRQAPYTVFHFSGHGVNTPRPALLVSSGTPDNDSRGKFEPEEVTAKDIGPILGQTGLKLAALLCCDVGIGPEWSGFGAQLVGNYGLPAVVSMQAPVMDQEADKFQEAFYRELASGAPVVEAVAAARRHIAQRTGEWEGFDWWVPVVHTQDVNISFAPTGQPSEDRRSLDELKTLLSDQLVTLRSDHPAVLATRRAIAHALMRRGDTPQALPILEELLEVYERKQGVDSRDARSAQRDIVTALKDLGRTPQALQEEEHLLSKQRRFLGDDHIDTLRTRRDIALLYLQLALPEEDDTGHGQKALEMLEEVLEDQEQSFGADHLEALETRREIAAAHRQLGRALKALECLKALRADQEQLFGTRHHHTLKTRNDMRQLLREGLREGTALYDSGQVQEALSIHSSLRSQKEQILGADHPDTLITRNNIAASLENLGRAEQALRAQEAVLADRERVLGPDHPDTLLTRTGLAASLASLGRIEEALGMFRAVLADLNRVMGPDHPHTLLARSGLAASLKELGWAKEALGLMEAVLADRERVLGPDHPHTLTTRIGIAASLANLGRAEEALELEEAVLADLNRVMGPDHPDALSARNNLALSLKELGRAEEALEIQEELLADRERVLGPDHPDTLTTRSGLAASLSELGRAEEALEIQQELLADRERVLGPDHPHTLTTRNNLAASLYELGRVEEALNMQQALLADAERTLGPDHPDTLTARNNLAVLLEKLGRIEEALDMQTAVLADRERVLGPDHPDTLKTRRAVDRLREQLDDG